MSDDAAPKPKQADEGAPAWVMTFADLMSLLMCFFVLLLSFSQMDLQKFKQVAGSMKEAFGVQRDIKADESPRGTSMVAQEYSPGKPTPTPVIEIRQNTIDESKQTVEFTDAEKISEKDFDSIAETDTVPSLDSQTKEDAKKLVEALREEIDLGLIQIEVEGNRVMIRIKEKASFPSGTATLRDSFLPVLDKIREALGEINGRVIVAGHTDNIPIKTARFRSNWDLSAARAVSVLHELIEKGSLPKGRFVVEGHGDAHPLVDNSSSENRAINRRVELVVVKNDMQNENPVSESGAAVNSSQLQ
jgi:chemotaxis protein MotB